MTRVLAFGDDLSADADTCWEWIASHRWAGWRLEVVTADPPADMHRIEPEAAELHRWEPEEPRPADGLGFDTVDYLRAEVDPRVALISKKWDLVAIGPRGSGMLKALHLGSTADWLLREPTSPLVIARDRGPVRKVLVATDGSAHSRRAMETLASLPWVRGVTVRALAVDDRHIDTDAALEEAAMILAASGAEVETLSREGPATREIISQVEEDRPDLVVLGARGRGGLERLVLGSTTSAVAGATERSILVTHADSGD